MVERVLAGGGLIDTISRPWPWYVVGPLVAFTVISLLLLGNKPFGVSSNLRHACASTLPCTSDYFKYDWRERGAWNLVFVLGILIGGWIAGHLLSNPAPIELADKTVQALRAQGIVDLNGLVPSQIFSWRELLTARGLILMVGGGFLVGFGTAYAGGCTSGHAIAGLADRQPASLLAVTAFFAGGLLATHFLLPFIVRL